MPNDRANDEPVDKLIYWPMPHIDDATFNGVVNLGRVETVDAFDERSDHGMNERVR